MLKKVTGNSGKSVAVNYVNIMKTTFDFKWFFFTKLISNNCTREIFTMHAWQNMFDILNFLQFLEGSRIASLSPLNSAKSWINWYHLQPVHIWHFFKTSSIIQIIKVSGLILVFNLCRPWKIGLRTCIAWGGERGRDAHPPAVPTIGQKFSRGDVAYRRCCKPSRMSF